MMVVIGEIGDLEVKANEVRSAPPPSLGVFPFLPANSLFVCLFPPPPPLVLLPFSLKL